MSITQATTETLTCPRGYTEIDYLTCKTCVDQHSTFDTCGACENVYNETAPFTCNDCENEICIFSGNKPLHICPGCNQMIKGNGIWKKINNTTMLRFCTETCGQHYKQQNY